MGDTCVHGHPRGFRAQRLDNKPTYLVLFTAVSRLAAPAGAGKMRRTPGGGDTRHQRRIGWGARADRYMGTVVRVRHRILDSGGRTIPNTSYHV